MSHIENKMSRYNDQLEQLKSKIAELEKEKEVYEDLENRKKIDPESNLETMNNWLTLMEPLKEYYTLIEKCNEAKIHIASQINPNIQGNHNKLVFFNRIPQWQNKYPDIINLERDIYLIKQNLPPYVYEMQSIGFTAPIKNGPSTLSIPSKFMIDFIDGTHNMCKLFSEKVDSLTSKLEKIESKVTKQ